MNDMIPNRIAWIAAQAEPPEPTQGAGVTRQEQPGKQNVSAGEFSLANLPVHNFPSAATPEISRPAAENAAGAAHPEGASAFESVRSEDAAGHSAEQFVEQSLDQFHELQRQRRIYRGRTVAMLRRYMRYSIETGRLPSILGREFFRAKVTSYTVTTFEDRVIFVHDMEICLERLDGFAREVLARVILQEYEHEEAAQLMGCTRMTVHRKLLEALDALSDILVGVGLLDSLVSNREKSCQGGKSDDFSISDCEHGK
ncbi:MAG TPA: sigma factor-like helix-turn-helix DNA-binding protein [Terriglobales bacterium]|nr:sigma factor-like helix-turn-helix DNA-binding protein [Terriglobales bacterium]